MQSETSLLQRIIYLLLVSNVCHRKVLENVLEVWMYVILSVELYHFFDIQNIEQLFVIIVNIL